jgi:PAS domain S-box-containing protein
MAAGRASSGPPRGAGRAQGLALLAIALVLPSVVGWLAGIPWLLQPLDTFAPARPGGVLLVPLAAAGLLVKLSGRLRLARALIVGCLLVAIAGADLPRGPLLPAFALPVSTALMFVMYGAGVWLLAGRPVSERVLVVVGALASSHIALAGVLFVTELTGLLDGAGVEGLRAPFFELLAALVLGVALLQRIQVREQLSLAPPRWGPVLAGVSAALVVVALWQALSAREAAQARARGALAVNALDRAVQRQYRTVERSLGRAAAFLGGLERLDETVWRLTFPRLVEETAGLRHVVWLDSTGALLRATDRERLTDATVAELARVGRALVVADSAASRSVALSAVPLRLALWYPVSSPVVGRTVVMGLVDEVELLDEFVDDVSREFMVRVRDGATVVAQAGETAAGPPYEAPMQIGVHALTVRVAQRVRVPGSTLPDVVLALGLVVALLLAITLRQQRRIWEQGTAVGMSRMQQAIERATDGVWELDVQQGRTHRSPGLLRYLAIDPIVLEGGMAAWSALVHPDDAATVTRALEAHLRGDTDAFECEYRLRAGDGSWHTLVDRGRVVERLADGRPVRLLGISADITERMRAEAARDASERRFRAMFETAYQVQLLLDLDGTILEANRAAAELAEVPVEVLPGRAFAAAPWWADDAVTRARVQERFLRARAGETQRFEVEVERRGERLLTIDFSVQPIVDASQQVVQVLAEGRDLTIRKRAEAALREASALTTMGQLAARVAHEINNPLAGIQNAFLLIRGAIPADHPHVRFVGAIEREIARIAAVTRQLYETYRPDEQMAAQSSVILAISDAVSFLEQVNRGRGVQVVTTVTQAPSLVPVPDALLRQTLYNLVQNAFDASPPDGTITVTAEQVGAECVLRVCDEGPGIPEALRERIFEPFFSTKDRTVRTGGMGIGLALVRQSVLAVGGRITVQALEPRGSAFEVRLPMIPVETGVLR